jgi:peptidoglycan/xylan/chitin deacetylase (PgdA/CDA1 family)
MEAHVYVCPQWIDQSASPWWFLLLADVAEGERLRLALIEKGICEVQDFNTDTVGSLPMRAIDKVVRAIRQEDLPALLRDCVSRGPSGAKDHDGETAVASWAELNVAADVLHVGSHTHNHAILGLCRDQGFMREQVIGAKARIEAMTGRPCLHFAYPRGRTGDFNEQTRAMVAAAGHRTAVTMREGMALAPVDLLAIPRFYVGETPVAELAATLSGVQQAWDRFINTGRRLLGRTGEPA